MAIKKSKKMRITLSVVALLEVLVLAAGVTFSWIEGGTKGSVSGSNITVSANSSLTMMYDGKIASSILIPSCKLDETSSADGRNFFFPLADNTTNSTGTMKFREGTMSDRNQKYVSLDFDLLAGESAADVFLGSGTIIQCANQQQLMNSLRMSFSANDGTTPTVFKPTQMPGVSGITYSPVTSLSAVGEPATGTTTTKSYGDYYYSGDTSTPLFHLNKGQTKHITMSLWLEGTTADFADSIASNNLSIYIDFSTTADDLIKYNFVDNCHNRDNAMQNNWVQNNAGDASYQTMMYVYDNQSARYYSMKKIDNTHWTAYVPKNITNFYFRRYSIDIDEWWNEWEPDMTDIKTDVNGEHTFVAICGQTNDTGSKLDGCYGYWKDQNGTFRIYFQNEAGWTNLKIYAWNTSSSATASTGAWPGKAMTYSHSNSGKSVYYFDLKDTENVAGIQFNNNNSTQKYEITDSQNFFNGLSTWYNGSNGGHWIYTDSLNSLIYPHK